MRQVDSLSTWRDKYLGIPGVSPAAGRLCYLYLGTVSSGTLEPLDSRTGLPLLHPSESGQAFTRSQVYTEADPAWPRQLLDP